MFEIAKLGASLGLDATQYNRGLDGAEQRAQGFGSSFARILEIAGGVSLANLGARLLALPKQIGAMAVETAARTETLGVALQQVGTRAGYTTAELDKYVAGIKKQGITTQEATTAALQFIQAQLDVAQATDLARVAQDLAVIAGTNSSQAFATLTQAVASVRPELLRVFGIISGMDTVLEAAGQKLGIYSRTITTAGQAQGHWTRELTATEKQQAMLNLIMAEGARVAGTYEAAMTTVGKKMGSLKRYVEEAYNAIGQYLLPIVGQFIDVETRLLKSFTEFLNTDEVRIQLTALSTIISKKIGQALEFVDQALRYIITNAERLWTVARDVLTVFVAWKTMGIFLAIAENILTVIGHVQLLKAAMLELEIVMTGPRMAGAILSMFINPLGLALIAVTALIAGLAMLAMREHDAAAAARALELSHNTQAAQIAITETKYTDYVTAMAVAGLASRTLTEDVYKLIQAHKDQADAATLVTYGQKLREWTDTLDVLQFGMQSASTGLAGLDAAARAHNATLTAQITQVHEQIIQYAALNPIFEGLARSTGILTNADTVQIAKLRELDAANLLVAESHRILVERTRTLKDGILAAFAEVTYGSEAWVSNMSAVIAGGAEEWDGYYTDFTRNLIEKTDALVVDVPSAWRAMLDAIIAATREYTYDAEAQVMDHFAKIQDEYSQHAQTIAQLESQKDAALDALSREAKGAEEKLTKAHDEVGLANLRIATKAKYDSILQYYNARIKTEQAAQSTLLKTAMTYLEATLKITQVQLDNIYQGYRANAIAMMETASGVYSAITASILGAAEAQRQLAAGQAPNLAAILALRAQVQGAYDAIASAGKAAANQAAAEYSAWQGATVNLTDALGDLGTEMGSVGDKGREAGGSIRTVFKDPVEEAAKAVQVLGDMVKRATEAFDLLAKYGGPKAGWQDAFARVLDNVKLMITEASAAAESLIASGLYAIEDPEKGTGPLSRLVAFAKAVSDTASMITDVAKGVDAISAMKAAENINGLIIRIADIAGQMARAVKAQEVGELAGLGEKFSAFAGALNSAVRPLSDVLKFWVDLDKFIQGGALHGAGKADAGARIAAMIASMASTLGIMVTELQRVQGWTQFGNLGERFDTFAKTLSGIVKPFSDILKFWDDLDKFVQSGLMHGLGKDGGKRLSALIASMASTLGIMVTEIQRVQGWTQFTNLGEAFDVFAKTLSSIVKPFSDILKFWVDLDKFVQGGLMHGLGKDGGKRIGALIASMASTLGVMATELQRVQRWSQFQSLDEDFDKFAKSLIAAAEALTKGLAFLVDLAAWKWTAGLEDKFTVFARQWRGIFEQFAKLRKDTQAFVDEDIVKFAQAMGDIADGLRAGVALLVDTGAWTATADVPAKIGILVATLESVLTALADEIANWDTKSLELVGAFGGAVGSLMTGLRVGMDLIGSIPQTWAPPSSAQWNVFTGWVQAVFQEFYTWANRTVSIGTPDGKAYSVPAFTETGLSTLGLFSTGLSNLMGGLKSALDVALALPDTTWETPNPTTWAAFTGWVKDVFTEFYTWANQTVYIGTPDGKAYGVPAFTETGLSTLGLFSTGLSSLMTGLKAALDVALALPESWSAPNVTLWDAFTGWVKATFTEFYTWLGGDFDADRVALVGTWGQALGSLMSGLTAAVGFRLGADWTAPGAAVWGRFSTWVKDVFEEFYTWLDGDFTSDGVTLVGTFGTALGSIMGGLKAALDLATALPASWTVDEGVWTNFIYWVSRTFDFLYRWATEPHGTSLGITVFTTKGMELVNAWGTALGSIFGGLKAALDLATALPTEWTVDPAVWNAFLGWAALTFDDLYVWITTLYPVNADTADQFAPVAAWGNALSAVMGGLQAALSIATDFTFTEPAGNTWAKFEGWVTAVMQRLVTWVNTTYPIGGDFEPVTSFGGAMSAVFGGLGAALDLFKGLQGYIGLLDSRIASFIASVTYAYGLVQTYATGAGVSAGTAATTAFANAVSAVMGALSSALSVFGQLVEGTSADTQTFKNRMATLIERISGTLVAFQTYVEADRDTTWVPAANAFSAAVGNVLDVLKKALDLFVALDEHGLPSLSQLQDLVNYTLQIFAQFKTGLEAAATNTGTAGTNMYNAANAALGYGSSLYATADNWGADTGAQWGAGLQWWVTNKSGTALIAAIGNANTPTGLYLGVRDSLMSQSMIDMVTGGGRQLGSYIVQGMAFAMDVTRAGNPVTPILRDATTALVNYITAQVRTQLGIASPSKVMTNLARNIPLGLAAGIIAGIPDVTRASRQLALAIEPGLAGMLPDSGQYAVSNERRIVVEFRGQAGGGVPLTPQQFDGLKRELSYAIRLGA